MIRSHHLTGPDGNQLAATCWRPAGVPVLLAHGFSNDRQVWSDVAASLPGRFQPIAVDLRGHGDSDWSVECRYALEHHAADLEAALVAFGARATPAAVVGHSLGGNAATLLAASRPDLVRALVLVDTGPSLSQAAWRWSSDDAARTARAWEGPDEYRALLGAAYPTGEAKVLDRLAASGLVRRVDGRYEPKLDPVLLELTGSEDDWSRSEKALWSALCKVQCPTLLVRGSRSAMFDEQTARRMVDVALADGRLVDVPAGHAVAIDAGARLAAAVAEFLEEVVD